MTTISKTQLLRSALALPEGAEPFPWQKRLLKNLLEGKVPDVINLPTGLGKSSVLPIALLAKALGADLPTRIVYVVDRRVLVDQATKTAERLRDWVAGNLEIQNGLGLVRGRGQKPIPLPISTLRGAFVDNREWLRDPSTPAVIAATVDMVASRIAFMGYNVSQRMRPWHAAYLGNDCLYIVDEAHLNPSFVGYLSGLLKNESIRGTCPKELKKLSPCRIIQLSATSTHRGEHSFDLTPSDRKNAVIHKRLLAKKTTTIQTASSKDPQASADVALVSTMATQALDALSRSKTSSSCLVYVNRRSLVDKVRARLQKEIKESPQYDKSNSPELVIYTGARRLMERTLAEKKFSELGLFSGTKNASGRHVIVIATSAAEVGVDLDLEHGVFDIVAWERMIQRCGRINRLGNSRRSTIRLIRPKDEKNPQHLACTKLLDLAVANSRRTTLELSPSGIETLERTAQENEEMHASMQASITPVPLRPAVDRPTIDAWSMTSLPEHSAIARLEPYYRGWETRTPQTTLVWRALLNQIPVDEKHAPLEKYLQHAPIHLSEQLTIESGLAAQCLFARIAKLTEDQENDERSDSGDTIFAVLSSRTRVSSTYTLQELKDKKKAELERILNNKTVIVDARVGGCSEEGVLEARANRAPKVPDSAAHWALVNLPEQEEPASAAPAATQWPVPWRCFVVSAGSTAEYVGDPLWRNTVKIPARDSQGGENPPMIQFQRKFSDQTLEDDLSTANHLQSLQEHQAWTKQEAIALAKRLKLPAKFREAVALAALLHDEGKRVAFWQRAARAPEDQAYAKTPGPFAGRSLGGYRHEFGSLMLIQNDPRVQALSDHSRDLVLHLVAAHHGFARPLLSTQGYPDQRPSRLREEAREIALRWERLQRYYGPLGLSLLECFLRAPDAIASQRNEERRSDNE